MADMLANSTSCNRNSADGHDRRHCPTGKRGPLLLCEDVLIDVCRWLTRRQLSTSIAPAGRRCWLRLFQSGQPLSVWPKHLAQELGIIMDGNFGKQPTEEFFCVSIRAKGRQQLNLYSAEKNNNNHDDDDANNPAGQQLSLQATPQPPDYVCFKEVRLQLLALCEEQNIEQHRHLDKQKLALVESLFNTFHGPVSTLTCWFMTEEFEDRAGLSAFLSHEFFDRFFAKFESVEFSGGTLPTKDDQIEHQPLLLLPGLLRCKRRLVFECDDYSNYVRDNFFMFGVNEIANWLNYASGNKERILYIRESGYQKPTEALFWIKNLLNQLKECLLGSTKARPYTLYIDGPIFDWPIENDQFGGLPRGLVARNPCTCEQLLFDAFEPNHDALPSGNEFVNDSMMPKPLGMFRRMQIGD